MKDKDDETGATTVMNAIELGIDPKKAVELQKLNNKVRAERKAASQLSFTQQIVKMTQDWIIKHYVLFLTGLSGVVAALIAGLDKLVK